MSKHVTWSSETKTHDGNPNYSIPYGRISAKVRQQYSKTIATSRDVSRQEYDMAWLEYCTANWVERGQASVL